MKQCSLHHFSESLKPWLDEKYIRKVELDSEGRITFSFKDGVSDSYEITDCRKAEIEKICHDLVKKGIAVHGL